MGLHAIDTIRRDAAEQGIKFETKYVEGTDRKIAEVKLITDDITYIYNIDLYNDVINEVSFSTKLGVVGKLEFTYLQDIDGVESAFVLRQRPRMETTTMRSHGVLWLTKLLEESSN